METGQTTTTFRVENLNRTFRSTVFETDGRRRHVRSTSQHRIQRLSVLIVSENRAVDDLRALGEAALHRRHINDRGTIGIHHIDDRAVIKDSVRRDLDHFAATARAVLGAVNIIDSIVAVVNQTVAGPPIADMQNSSARLTGPRHRVTTRNLAMGK